MDNNTPVQANDDVRRDLFAPRVIAVVGASSGENAVTARPLRFLKRHRFPGAIYAVNPRHKSIAGVACYGSIRNLPQRPDVALIGVPSGSLEAAVADCIAAGVPLICIFTAAVDASTKARIVDLARAGGSRLLGPNSLGFIDTHSRTACTYSQVALLRRIPRGHLSIVSQSGGLGGCLLNRAIDGGIGIARFLTPGAGIDIDLPELLDDLARSPQTRAVAAIVESISDGERFIGAVERLHAAQKRLVILRIGGSATGRALAVSHTGALASDEHIFAAVCRGLRVPLVGSLDELVEVAAAYTATKSVGGPSVGIVTSSGGAAIMVADAFEAQNLSMPAPSPATARTLRTTLPSTATISNPLDIGAGQGSQAFRTALQTMSSEPAFDSIVVALTMVAGDQADAVIPELIDAASQHARPLAVIWPAGSLVAPWRRRLRKHGIAVFENPAFAATALRENRPGPSRPQPVMTTQTAFVARARTIIAGAPGVRTEWRTRQLLEVYGIESPAEALVASRDDAVSAAQRIGFPVALKVQSPLLPHRAKAGALLLDLGDAQAVAEGYDRLLAALNPAAKQELDGILVQAMVVPEHEILLGVLRDPIFGPIIACGAGGGNVEKRNDIFFVLPSDDRNEFATLLSKQELGTRIGAAGIVAVSDLMVRLSQLAIDIGPSLAELDINPVALLSGGTRALALDALAVTTDVEAQLEPSEQRLRQGTAQ
jgi:acyl-CoA synthetase (NDP forming)